MKIGIFSDAHGNEIGFEQCLHWLRSVADEIYFLGDAVGYFPFPNEIIDELRTGAKIHSLMGNHDAMLLGFLAYEESKEDIYRLKQSKEKLSAANEKFMERLTPFRELNIDGKRVLFVHGSPHNPLNGYFYPDTSVEQFEHVPYDVIFMGHTHRSFIKEINQKLIVNVGSCGFSRDIGNVITAALYDTVTDNIEMNHLCLDIDLVLKKYENDIHDSVKEVLRRNNKPIHET
ncbi:metallophosphoesterase family protein [Taibaiella helva]|uniref:metallophosphoesterase family protein n=1 Tax=Taibaiella helva TaxID=2301235 RepID=UPI000E57CDE6|nr:metallophosphoesterase family protein [Taibaiella helva]